MSESQTTATDLDVAEAESAGWVDPTTDRDAAAIAYRMGLKPQSEQVPTTQDLILAELKAIRALLEGADRPLLVEVA